MWYIEAKGRVRWLARLAGGLGLAKDWRCYVQPTGQPFDGVIGLAELDRNEVVQLGVEK